jgi:hypothetical protein
MENSIVKLAVQERALLIDWADGQQSTYPYSGCATMRPTPTLRAMVSA